MSEVIALKPVKGSTVRFAPADAIALLCDLETRGWIVRVVNGQLMVNANGQAIPREVAAGIKRYKKDLIRLVDYADHVP